MRPKHDQEHGIDNEHDTIDFSNSDYERDESATAQQDGACSTKLRYSVVKGKSRVVLRVKTEKLYDT